MKLRYVCGLLGALALASACSKTHEDKLQGGETNWLSSCDDDGSCGEGSCVCGVCSERCDQDEDCPDGLVCRGPATALVRNTCGESTHGLCTPECMRDEECGEGRACGAGACTILMSSVAPDAGLVTGDSGAVADETSSRDAEVVGYDALINAFLRPEPPCEEVAIDSPVLAAGLLDVAQGGTAESTSCRDPYRVHAWVKSFGHEDLFIMGAEVELLTSDRRPIVFNRGELELQNPYAIDADAMLKAPEADGAMTEGVVELELVPVTYIDQLGVFDGNQIIATVTLLARNADGERVTFATTPFGISICVGCSTFCLQRDVLDVGLTPEEVGDSTLCADNAGANGTACIDPEC